MSVQVLVGSKTDLPQIVKVGEVLAAIRVAFAVHVISAHRNPDDLREFCQHAQASDVQVFITAAGWAAALSGSVAAATGFMVPVIGIPLSGGPYANDSLYAMASMPPGCPVLVVPTPENAAIAAAQIVAVRDAEIGRRLREYLYAQKSRRQPQMNVDLVGLPKE